MIRTASKKKRKIISTKSHKSRDNGIAKTWFAEQKQKAK